MRWIVSLLLLSVFASCGDSTTSTQNTNTPTSTRGNRHIGFHVTQSEFLSYDESFQIAKSTGMSVLPITFVWSAIEKSSGSFDSTLPSISNIYYPAQNVRLCLTISPIYAVGKSVPADLTSERWNSPTMISRFAQFLMKLHNSMPNVSIAYVILGNEVNLGLHSSQEWSDYKVFVTEGRKKIKQLWGDSLAVGVESTLYGSIGENRADVQDINTITDFYAVSYYPLESDFTMKSVATAKNELDQYMQMFSGKPVILEETGYASSAVCLSNESKQSDYTSMLMSWWDANSNRVPFIGMLWLHDLSPAQTEQFAKDYGITNVPAFSEYLRTLGFRTYSGAGTNKAAFNTLLSELQSRKW